MGLNVPDRVHIMPVGYEYQRIIEPAEEFRADRVVLLGHEGDKEGDEGIEHLEKTISALENQSIALDIRECDIFDLYSSMGSIAEAISDYEEDDVYVNVSTGSKVTAIAGMITSMVLDCIPYYARALNYEDNPAEIQEVTELPTYPIDAPDSEQVDIMEFINRYTEMEGPPTKGDLIFFSDHANLEYISRNVAGKGKYRLLDTHIVEPLKERGFIMESKQGRNKILTLTEQGDAALEAFQWLIDEEIDWTILEQMVEKED